MRVLIEINDIAFKLTTERSGPSLNRPWSSAKVYLYDPTGAVENVIYLTAGGTVSLLDQDITEPDPMSEASKPLPDDDTSEIQAAELQSNAAETTPHE